MRPNKEGDFNDILRQKSKSEGVREIKSIFEPAINHLSSYSKEQAEIITSYQGGISSNLDEFLKNNSEYKSKILAINPNYDFNILRNKLSGVSDLVRREVIKHEIYNQFKPYVTSKMDDFHGQKQNATNYKEFLAIAAKEKEFTFAMYRDYEDQARMLTFKEQDDKLSHMHYAHRMNTNLLSDLNRNIGVALNNKISTSELALIQMKNKSLILVNDYLYKECKDILTRNVISQLDVIKSKEPNNKQWMISKARSAYLEKIINDKNLKPYVQDFAKKELEKTSNAQRQQQITSQKQQKQTQQHKEQMQQQKKHISFDKGGFSM